ncbi:MAG: ATP-binding protein [Saprospiraceae bacterium]|jgi:signal transduction histidine kinase|nr:ATP-binding protein [Saprospiraceae bacterium]
MRQLCFFFLSAGISPLLNAQSDYAATLQNSIKNGAYELALHITDSVLADQQRAGNAVSLANYINRGTFLYLSGRSREAIQVYQNCLSLAEYRHDTLCIAALCANMGNALFTSWKYQDASAYYFRAIPCYAALRDTFNMAMLYYQIAQCYLYGPIPDATTEVPGFVKKLRALNHPHAQFPLTVLNGQVATRQGDYQTACTLLTTAAGQAQKTGNTGWSDNIALCVMDLYVEMEKARDKNLPVPSNCALGQESLGQTLVKANTLAQKRPNLPQKANAAFALYRYYLSLNDNRNAAEHLNRYHHLREELASLRSSEENSRMEAEYKTRDQRRQVELLNAQNEQQKAQSALAIQQRERALLEARTEAERRDNLLRLMAAQRELDTCAIQSARIELAGAALENTRKAESIALLHHENALHQAQNQRQQLLIALLIALAALGGIAGRMGWRRIQERRLAALRARISRDLHDDLGSALSSIAMNGMLAAQIGEPDRMREVLARISAEAQTVSSKVRDLTWSLHPDSDSMDELLVRIRRFAAELFEDTHIHLHFEIGPGVSDLKPDLDARRHLYLIVKEALNNAAKYADATEVHIRMYREGKKLALEVADNGSGFDPATASHGNGLNNMAARAALLGGELRVQSAERQGTLVRVVFGVK